MANRTYSSDITSTPTWNYGVLIPSIIMMLLSIGGFFGNVLIVCVVVKYRNFRSKYEALYLIGFLAVTDSLMSLGAAVAAADRAILEMIVVEFTRRRCLAVGYMLSVGISSGQLMILAIAYDRFKAVSSPNLYRAKNHFRFAWRCFAAFLTFAVVNVGCTFTGDLRLRPVKCNMASSLTPTYLTYTSIFTTLLAFLIICTYIAIPIALHRHGATIDAGINTNAVQSERQAKVTKALTIILSIYIVSWLVPVVLSSVFIGLYPSTGGIFGSLLALGAVVNGGANVFVYGLKMPEFKNYLQKFCKIQSETAVVSVQLSNNSKL